MTHDTVRGQNLTIIKTLTYLMFAMFATRYGSVFEIDVQRARRNPCATIRVEPSGNFNIFRTCATQIVG